MALLCRQCVAFGFVFFSTAQRLMVTGNRFIAGAFWWHRKTVPFAMDWWGLSTWAGRFSAGLYVTAGTVLGQQLHSCHVVRNFPEGRR